MKSKFILILIIVLLITSCTPPAYKSKIDFSNSNMNIWYMNYVFDKHNEDMTTNFTDVYLSSEPSYIQQYYYVNIMHLLTGEYTQEHFDILESLLFEDENYKFLEIAYFVLANSSSIDRNNLSILENYCKELIEIYDTDAYLQIRNDYVYSVLIVNIISGYPLDRLNDLLYEAIIGHKLPYNSELNFMYFYSLANDARSDDGVKDEIKDSLNRILARVDYINDHLSVYYCLYLINYFDFEIEKMKIGKNMYSRFGLLDPNLRDAYFKLYYFMSLGLLSESEINYLYEYYTALCADNGFGSYVSNSDSMDNINYGYYAMLNSIILNNTTEDKFLNIELEYFSEDMTLDYASNLKLYIMGLLQYKKNKAINANLKNEVIDRILSVNDESDFSELYYLFLIAKNFNFENEVLIHERLNEHYLTNSLNTYLNSSSFSPLLLKYFDILSLYYPEHPMLDNFYLRIKGLLHLYAYNGTYINSLMNYLTVLKSIEIRLGISDSIMNDFGNIIEPIRIDNFLIVNYGGRYNNIMDYYDYYMLSSSDFKYTEAPYILR